MLTDCVKLISKSCNKLFRRFRIKHSWLLVFDCLFDLASALPILWCHLALTSGIRAGHLSYWCDPEGEEGHDCYMQKTIMLKDGRYGHWKVRMKLLVRGINDATWIAVKTGWEEPTILQQRGRSPSLMSQYKEWFER